MASRHPRRAAPEPAPTGQASDGHSEKKSRAHVDDSRPIRGENKNTPFPNMRRIVANMWLTLTVLLVAWAVLTIVGFAFEGLLWLAIIGIVLFVGTLVFGLIRTRNGRKAP